MQPAPVTSGTAVPAGSGGTRFPPFKTETFPSQLFWLAITFAVLYVVLWRVAAPRIQSAIAARRGRIADDIGAAEKHHREAEEALAAYQAALAAARVRAQAVAEENRKHIAAEVERAKTLADTEAQKATSAAEACIAALRTEAKGHVVKAAQDAVIAIVSRLAGDTISPEDAAAAVRSAGGS